MSQGPQGNRGLQLVARAANALRVKDWTLNEVDPDGLRYVGSVSVRVHWFFAAVLFIELVYRPPGGATAFLAFALLFLLLVGFTGYTHYRLWSDRSITWRWILAIGAIDMFNISAAVAIRQGFSDIFFYLLYFPVLAGFAVVFTSFRLNMACVTMASAVYAATVLGVGDGLDIEARDEKVLLARIAVMYGIVATVNMVSRFERMRWRETVERERALQRERIDLSQAIHDTTAQSAYMIGLGIDTAKALAADKDVELTATLEGISQLSRSAVWELRHPINMGRIYEGGELSRVLRSHATSFMRITAVSTEMTQTGLEPPISTHAKSLLFSIAHNALTNAYRHAEASSVSISLEFGEESIRLSVSDDGIGLPDD